MATAAQIVIQACAAIHMGTLAGFCIPLVGPNKEHFSSTHFDWIKIVQVIALTFLKDFCNP